MERIMYVSRQSSLYHAANAAGFATVWYDDAPIRPLRGLPKLIARIVRFFA